ncbi:MULTISPECIES: DUF5839 family protein [unclassified Sporosarcina]|uniref:DUF5839 family protein n=1 Tax=unclassified Sporosarcina TaxID=2647733 RepID=UPI000C16513A|nr:MULTISPECIES: DUF5839 family protein [unclassified Sporosarcina]PIC98566.1 hypothetical protein CSV68_12240 [Sporosarcina sp. P29]PID05993.1 hypothetical protein CSV66_07230 [Sporosarcina sp. P30]PID09187.1 hypothetical protein CSV65_07230 [Sporosarcina sp. P31]PID12485.1 hypothetical protein CSV64_06700 [Sporosarcina sp. P32b]
MDMNNTIKALHILGNEDGVLKLNTEKFFTWHIPKKLREEPIQKGDIVLVRTKLGLKSVLVMDVYREEFEETQKRYKRVIKIFERAPQK